MWWDKRGMIRAFVREWQPVENRKLIGGKVYDDYGFTVDGQWYRGHGYLTNRARIGPAANEGRGYCTPLTLMGVGINSVPGSVCRYVSEKGQWKFCQRLNHGLLRVTGEYAPSDGTVARTIELTLDPRQEYLPIEIVTRFLWSNTTDQQIRVTRTDVVDGVRIPTAGSVTAFFLEEVYPDGLTIGEVNAMSREDYFRLVEPRTLRFARPLGEPLEVEFDVAKIRVNDIQDESFFRLDIPEDADLLDLSDKHRGSSSRPETAKQGPRAIPDRNATPVDRLGLSSTGWTLLVMVNVTWLLGAIAVRWYRAARGNRVDVCERVLGNMSTKRSTSASDAGART
jgi:hypothetical protein